MVSHRNVYKRLKLVGALEFLFFGESIAISKYKKNNETKTSSCAKKSITSSNTQENGERPHF